MCAYFLAIAQNSERETGLINTQVLIMQQNVFDKGKLKAMIIAVCYDNSCVPSVYFLCGFMC